MGCDVCYTNHAEADQNDMDNLLTLLAVGGVTYVMGVPGGDDIMLNYQSTSYHDVLAIRQILKSSACAGICGVADEYGPHERGRLGAPGRLAGSALPAACEDLTFVELEKVSSDIDRLWTKLRAVTPARIGLARNGSWVETRLLLDFQLAHAEAQDAVKDRIDADRLIADLKSRGLDMVCLSSKAPDRKTYLARPDFGRELNESAKDALLKMPKGFDVVFVLCDGLSADAVMLHATTLLDETLPSLLRDGWSIGPVAVVEQGRVAIGDEIGQLLQASLIVVLIGERPGLTSPKSLGVYLTWTPRVGRSDAERNCLSNVHPEGMSYREAADRLTYLCREARSRQLTGVNLKDNSIRRSSVSQLRAGRALAQLGWQPAPSSPGIRRSLVRRTNWLRSCARLRVKISPSAWPAPAIRSHRSSRPAACCSA